MNNTDAGRAALKIVLAQHGEKIRKEVIDSQRAKRAQQPIEFNKGVWLDHAISAVEEQVDTECEGGCGEDCPECDRLLGEKLMDAKSKAWGFK
jgi:hypothetical protein